MPATATLLGGAMGLGVQLYSNAVRKLPLMRSACLIHPWEHVIGIGAGALAGSYLADWEERTIKETTILEQNRERKFTGANLSDKE